MEVAIVAIVMLVLVVALVSSTGASTAKAKEARMKKLADIAAHLGGQHDESSKAWGTALGAKTTFEFATRGAGSSSENWTHIDVEIPKAYPLAIHVRRHTGSDRQTVARGEMVDVLVGDLLFDDAFLVEAAPADVVRALFDAGLRGLLSAHEQVDLETIEKPDGTRAIRFGRYGWTEDLEALKEPLAVIAKLGANVRTAYANADAAHEQLAPGDPYRPLVDAQPSRDAQAGREAEVGRVKAVREKRAADARAMAIAVIVIIALVCVIGIAAMRR